MESSSKDESDGCRHPSVRAGADNPDADEGELLGGELVAVAVQRRDLQVPVRARRAAIGQVAIRAEGFRFKELLAR
jgi:hypothetical protein